MSDHGALTVNVRHKRGKGAARSLRREGKIPAVLYGAGGDNILLALDPNELRKATDPERDWNTLYTLTLEGDGQSTTAKCMVADVQRDSIKRNVKHLDFVRIDPDREVIRQVPVVFTGRAAGVAKGGKLKTFRRLLKVAAKPDDLPVRVEVDVTPVDGGQSLRVKDVPLQNARLVENPEQRLCLVEMPKVKKTEEEEAAAAKGKKK